MKRALLFGLLILLLGLGLLGARLGERLLRSDIEARVYRERLGTLERDYEVLRSEYETAIRRTAVTELVVEDGRLRVAIRDASGQVRTIDTPFDPSREIYVDFVILNGRLWIRRIFDAGTPPERGLLVDPGLEQVDWRADPEGYGKAAYRSLEEGRWVLTVTGDGSLGLARSEGDTPTELAPPPEIRRFEPVERTVEDTLAAIQPLEAVRAVAARAGLLR